jgi:CRISPR-associated protein Cmr6
MSPMIPLPEPVWSKVAANSHPGLALDKYAQSWEPGAENGNLQQRVQQPTLIKVVQLSRRPIDEALFKSLAQRRKEMLSAFKARTFDGEAEGPLTLHLSRASSLENAGICLHPLYGFTYLPGSGLKGLARAFAETVWLKSQPTDKQQAARAEIEQVFGSIGKRSARSGAVVFHDAWPASWPALEVDIVNNHHGKYYRGEDHPGDWENPVPVYFLSVRKGARFSFAIGGRLSDVKPEQLSLAEQWLKGGLALLGAGAKTNAGYGGFKFSDQGIAVKSIASHLVCDVEVELVTPAFLAGASQDQSDCDLRPATLRGLLRWWWRTLHAGHLRRDSLRALESAIWGDTKAGGAVRVTVKRKGNVNPRLFNYKQGYAPNPEFKTGNDLSRAPDTKTSQGLFYLSYGMDDAGRRRWYAPAGSSWVVSLLAKDVSNGMRIPAVAVLEQAKAALWLLCRFGGVGAKCRKGFGSLRVETGLSGISLEKVTRSANEIRRLSGLNGTLADEPAAPSIDRFIHQSVPTPWTNYWYALDQLGFAVQVFAKRYKHNVEKRALGLPRRIGPPTTGRFRAEKGNRHASPVHLHFDKQADGKLFLEITAFPSAYLPDFKTSQNFIQKFAQSLVQEIGSRSSQPGKGIQPVFPALGQNAPASLAPHAPTRALPKAGDWVGAVLLEEKTKKQGWKAKHEPSGLSGVIINHTELPPDKKAGDRIDLVVAFANDKEIHFRFDSGPKDDKKTKSVKPQHGKKQGDGQKRK